jgi:hypothetical protein
MPLARPVFVGQAPLCLTEMPAVLASFGSTATVAIESTKSSGTGVPDLQKLLDKPAVAPGEFNRERKLSSRLGTSGLCDSEEAFHEQIAETA